MRRYTFLALFLCLALESPLLAAPGVRKGAKRAPAPVPTAAAPYSLGQLWHHLTALWGAEGCGADPSGARCAASSSGHAAIVPPAPEGCGADPSGLCSR
jgi:hypothetical protein